MEAARQASLHVLADDGRELLDSVALIHVRLDPVEERLEGDDRLLRVHAHYHCHERLLGEAILALLRKQILEPGVELFGITLLLLVQASEEGLELREGLVGVLDALDTLLDVRDHFLLKDFRGVALGHKLREAIQKLVLLAGRAALLLHLLFFQVEQERDGLRGERRLSVCHRNGVEKVMDRLDLAAHLLVELNDRLLHAFDDRLRLGVDVVFGGGLAGGDDRHGVGGC
mmetsp:Transcript_44937/g.105443  ORF Transcript_44937/g.105443 Transcript_44937/m.105443 type:complete len:229 (+) Transcript_44937:337-1023(+)